MDNKSFLEKAPQIVFIATATLFGLSFISNYIYFFLLGINITLVPLTIQDYSLSPNMYIVPCFLGGASILNSFLKRRSSATLSDVQKKSMKKFFLIPVLIIGFIVLVLEILNMKNNLYYFGCAFIYIIYAPMSILFYKNEAFITLFTIFVAFCIITSASLGAIKNSILNNTGFIIKNEAQLSVIRTFEKGILVFNEELEPIFLYNDEKIEIHFPKNNKLIEFIQAVRKSRAS